MKFELGKGSQWPKALSQKDCNLAIKNRFQSEVEKRYQKKLQALCKILAFGMINEDNRVEGPDYQALKTIISQAKATAPFLSSLMLGVGSASYLAKALHSSNMKLIGLLVIFCRSTH